EITLRRIAFLTVERSARSYQRRDRDAVSDLIEKGGRKTHYRFHFQFVQTAGVYSLEYIGAPVLTVHRADMSLPANHMSLPNKLSVTKLSYIRHDAAGMDCF